ncbi:Aldo/keto reductase [Bauldia litoralis]|uniref:Aldo/keto reductase n=1 Tax=Bauldia litoralis TaxID=665467 RepID=A0A1G6B1B8_9HYPH|nr:aldo/keto reductase [Bauldia litoralis]SDB14480.1 Aldo/keto reductase [Bauldia litoralis]
METVTAHGATIPVIGFGTWNIGGDICARAVEEALKVGYRHIDAAAGYKNEDIVGGAIKASGVPREELFITTKVAPENLADDDFQRSAEKSVEELGVDQVDLLLIHWPSKTLKLADTIRSLNKAKERGLTRHIGVSNFTTKHLEEAWAVTDAPLVTNQCEYHPYLNQDKVLKACRDKGMFFTAFSPLAREAVLSDPVIGEIATRHGKTPAQVILRWDVQQDRVVAIPKSSNPERIASNFDVFGLSLSDDEMAAISRLSQTKRRRVANPAHLAPEWDD